MAIDHQAIGNVIFNEDKTQAIGVSPNPYAHLCDELVRRDKNKEVIDLITKKIEMLYEPRFITPPETSELIESLVTASDARNILEVGCYSGYTSLHMLRAIVGKEGARLTGIDCRPAHDREFFSNPEIAKYFRQITAWTPQAILDLKGEIFDFCFIDSDHTLDHTEKERVALMQVTKPGCIWLFHDLPSWISKDDHRPPPIVRWVNDLVHDGFLSGLIFPTPRQADLKLDWGHDYPVEMSPRLGVFRRN